MKACVLHDIGVLKYEEVKTPTPGIGEVLIEVKASGICGSDLPRIYTKGTYHFPTIPGHEFAGRIVETGKGSDKDLLGKKAAVFPLLPCMECAQCHIGEYAACRNYNYFGSRCDGGFAEYIAVPVFNLVMVSEHLSYEEAAMAEPTAVAIHALRQTGIEIGDNVVIYGAGPIGLIMAQWAKVWGADQVILVDIDEGKLSFAKELGFSYAYNSLEGDPVERIMELTGGRGADVAVEGAGVSQTLEQCLRSVRTLGRVVAMGNPVGDMRLSQKGYWELLRKQITLKGTWNSSYGSLPKNDWQLSIRAMEQGKISVKPIITHKFFLEDCIKAFEMIRNKRTFFNKVMFLINSN